MQDIFLGKYVHEKYPKIELHLSTQAGVCNLDGARLAKEYGFSRVILARETPLEEIKKIADFMETEVFVQGALCTCFSGQCYFSSFAGGNSGNRGRCKQPCRKLYAYDRKENTEKNYALSLSDLCVGEDIQKLIEAGVVSFKIEGRMRRPEYVASAVRYYRAIIDQSNDFTGVFSDLRRTYNRGNYTKGLAFGQDKRFLSTAIQGHIGEKVGVVKVIGGKYTVESSFKPQNGDGFKILRDGQEIGGATYQKTEGRGFVIASKIRLRNGDSVFVTTDTAVAKRVLDVQKSGEIHVKLSFVLGEFATASCENILLKSQEKLQEAQSRPLTKEELTSCFLKTDGLPVTVCFDEITLQGDIFIPKSTLNAFRREFYALLAERYAKNGNPFTGPHMHMVLLGKPADGIANIDKNLEILLRLKNTIKKELDMDLDSHTTPTKVVENFTKKVETESNPRIFRVVLVNGNYTIVKAENPYLTREQAKEMLFSKQLEEA